LGELYALCRVYSIYVCFSVTRHLPIPQHASKDTVGVNGG
jgi:hypothetical protein